MLEEIRYVDVACDDEDELDEEIDLFASVESNEHADDHAFDEEDIEQTDLGALLSPF